MRGLLGAIAKEGMVSLIALIVLCAVVWFGGELYDREYGTNTVTLRIIIIICLLVIFLLLYLVQKYLAVRSAMYIEKQLRLQSQQHLDSTTPENQTEVEALQSQFNESLGALKTSNLGAGALYNLPWYVIIGPPGAGKSTALQESGLSFPSIGQGPKSIRGIGGTRNCDWWFTEEGILLDTAGRYTTELEDQDEWFAFLDLLKRSRKHKPINGAIVAVAISELISASDGELEEMASTIRDRIDELSKRLELVFPIYLVFTKCDLLSGFVEFFEDLDKTGRSQVWGHTMAYKKQGERDFAAYFGERANELLDVLRRKRTTSLATDRPPHKKQATYLFPLQFELARKKLSDFVGMLFRPNPFQESAILRGFYFTSGTQKGRPINQVVNALGHAFGMNLQDEGPAEEVEKKSYFLKDLFQKIIFSDANLARSSSGVIRRKRSAKILSVLGSLIGFAGLLLLLLISFLGNLTQIAGAKGSIEDVKEIAEEEPNDVEKNLEAIEELRSDVAKLEEYDKGSPPLLMRWGFYRGGTLLVPARAAYFTRVKEVFVAPAAKKMQEEIRALRNKSNKNDKEWEELFDLHTTCQILAGKLPLASLDDGQDPDSDEGREQLKQREEEKRAQIKRVLKDKGRWLAGLNKMGKPGGGDEEVAYAQLDFFLGHMGVPADDEEEKIAELWQIEYDQKLLETVNHSLSGAYWIQESWKDIKNQTSRSVKTRRWGSKVDKKSLISGGGQDLIEIPDEAAFSAIFTQEGWNTVVDPAISAEAGILAAKYKEVRIDRPAEKIRGDLIQYYIAEYRENWKHLAEETTLLKFKSLADTTNQLKLLSGLGDVKSPYQQFFDSAWEGRKLEIDGKKESDSPTADLAWLDAALAQVKALYNVFYVFGEATANQTYPLVFYHRDGGKLKSEFQANFSTIDQQLKQAIPTGARSVAEDLLVESVGNARAALLIAAQAEADKFWKDMVYDPFQKDFASNFPFSEKSGTDINLSTFSKMFNRKNGDIQETYKTLNEMKGININQKPLLTFSVEFEQCWTNARQISEALYDDEGATISVDFKVHLEKGTGVTDVEITVGKSKYRYGQDPRHNTTMTWKQADIGADLKAICGTERKELLVGKQNAQDSVFGNKPWGVIRLIRAARKVTVSSGGRKFVCEYEVTGTMADGKNQTFDFKVTYEAPKDVNPFAEGFFSKFTCPSKVG